jgi:2-oxoglutarate dehydrogenase E1 component
MTVAVARYGCSGREVRRITPDTVDDFKAVLARFPQAKEIVWCQEEPQNQGAWYRLQWHLQKDIGEKRTLAYAGRAISASPAPGYASKHLVQQKKLIEDAFGENVVVGEMLPTH